MPCMRAATVRQRSLRVDCVVHLRHPIEQVFSYLSDFTTAPRWDPVTRRAEFLAGDGREGTTYRSTMSIAGWTTRLEHRVVEYVPANRLRLAAAGAHLRVEDTFTFRATDRGTTVHAIRDVQLLGRARLFTPLLGPALAAAGGRGEQGLRACLEPLPLAA